MAGVKRIGTGAQRSSEEGCIFCKIRDRVAPSYIVYEDEKHIAFLDAFPFSSGHTLVCPKRHGETIWDMEEMDIAELFQVASRVSKAVVAAVGADGFRLVQNNGEAANQVVAHVHVHVIPVRMVDRGTLLSATLTGGGRKSFTPQEMDDTARGIRANIPTPKN